MAYALNPITLRPMDEEPTTRMMASGVPAQGFLGPQATPSGETATALMETVTEPILNQGAPTNIPLLVPGQVNLEHLLSGNPPTPDQFEIALKHALGRAQAGERIPSYASIDEAVAAAKAESDARGVALNAPGGRPGAGMVQGVPANFFADLEQSKAPVIERSLPGEALAGLARGAGPGALGTLGQAARGLGFEDVGTTIKGYGERLQAYAPSVFRPSTAAQQANTWANTIATASESMGTSATLTVPALGLTALSGGGAGPLLAAFALSTPLIYGSAEYQNVYDEGRAAGIPDAVLQAPAFKSALSETGWEFASNVAEALMLRSGLGRTFARTARARWRQGIKAGMTPALSQTLAEMGVTGAAEAIGEGATQYQQEQFRQEVGIPTGPSQVGTAATAGAIAGLTFGVLGKGTMRVMRGLNLQALASPTAEPQTRMQTAQQVITQMDESGADPELIAQFRQASGQAIAQGQPIPLGEDIAGLGVQPTAPEAPEQGPPAPMQGPPAPMPQQPGLFDQPAEVQPAPPETTTPTAPPQEIPPEPIVPPEATQAVQPPPMPEAPQAIEPPAPLVPPRGPQVPAGTSARLLAPRETPLQASTAVTPELQAPEVTPPANVQPRAPQLPSGTMNRQVIQPQPRQPTAVLPPGDVGTETPVPPVSDATLAAPPGPAPAPPAAPTRQAPVPIATPRGGSYPFSYEWVDAAETIPSHNPQSFSVNSLYEEVSGMPVGATQDRAYHREPAEQAKVVDQDRQFPQRYGFMLSTSPDATHGPPVMPSDSNVTIAGNSRLMTILRKIQEPEQPGYQDYLRDANQLATSQGIGPAPAGMQAPILMRRLTDLSTNDREAMQQASREFNEPWTQALSEKAQAVASGKALSAETVAYLGDQLDALGEEATLRDFFRTAASRELIRRLQADGVLTQRTINRYVDDQGMLNEDGKTLVERAILGRVLPDSDLIDAAPASTINTLIKALPALTQLQARGDLWDITQHLPEAVKLATDTKLNGWNTVEQYLKQGGLFGEQDRNPVAIAMAEQLLSAKPTQTKRAFDRMAAAANRDVAGQGGFEFAPRQPPWEAFNTAFGANLSAEAYRQALDPTAAPPEATTEQFQARPQTQAQGGGEPWTLTRQEVDASFPSPGYRVLELPEGGYRISTQAGYVDLLQVDQIQMGPEQRIAFQMGYGTPYSDDLSVNARFIHENGQSRIELIKGKADRVSLLHDVEHWIEQSGQLTPAQIQQLSEATGKGDATTAEDRAEFVARSLNDRRYRRDTAVGRVLDQIWDYLDRLLALVGIHTTRGILRSIETGQGLNRPAPAAASQSPATQQFQATPRTPRPTLEQAPTENKLFTEYQSFLNYANPTVEQLFRTNDANFLKQKISLGQMNRESAAILEYWDDHRGEMTRVLRSWQQHQQLPRRDELGALLETGKAYSDVLMAGVRDGTLTNEDFIAQKDKLTGPNTIFNLATGMASEWGRIGVIFQQYRPEDRFMQLMIQKQERIGRLLTPEEHAAYVAEFNKVAMTGDAAALDKFFGKVKAENPTVWDYLKEFWYGSVLSGFPTWIANPGGNTLWTTFSLGALRPVEAFLDHFIAKQQNRPQQYFMSEVLPSLMGYGRGLAQKKRWQALYPGLKTGDFEMPGAAGISKMESEMEMFSSHWQHAKWQLDFPLMRKLGLDMGPVRRALKSSFGIEPGQPIHFMRTMAPIVSLGTRVMIGMDHLGRAAAYDGIIQGMVERQLQQELRAGALTPEQMDVRRTALLQQTHDGDNPRGEPMRKSAALQAREFTFQDEKSAIANFILKGRTLPIIGRPFQMLFPFVATADRLIYRALELTPFVGALMHHDELTHWKTAGPALTSVLARQMTGVFISAVMLALFKDGILTGDLPDDPGEREALLRTGWQPRSFKVGDTYISYQRFEPLNLMLGWLPSMVQAYQRAKARDDDIGALSIIGTMGAISVKHIIDGSYFSGFNSFLMGLNRPSGDQTESFLSRMVDSWVPFSGARRSITRAWDAYQTGEGAVVRDPKGFLEYISGASLVSEVRPRFNVFGQPIVTPGNVAAQFLPYRISVATHDPVENELARFKIYPGPPSQQDAQGNKLSAQDYAFLVQHGGQRLKGKLDRLVTQPYYQQLNESLRKKSLERAILQGRREAREELAARSRARGLVGGGG